MEHHHRPSGTRWHRLEDLPDEGRVITAVVDGRSVALTRCRGKLGALALFSEKGWAATGARDVAAAAGVSVEKNAILIASSGPRPPNRSSSPSTINETN